MRPRRRRVWRLEAPQRRRDRALHVQANPRLRVAQCRDRDYPRHPLLQQQLGRPDHRLVVEAGAHLAAIEDVGEGDHRHSLMVGHVGPDDGVIPALR